SVLGIVINIFVKIMIKIALTRMVMISSVKKIL
ncbi:MAG: hypothetical protein ACI9YP_000804, partial [Colwellia sp.]